MLCLLDGDLVAHRCAATCENEDEAILYYRINELIQRILDTVQAKKYMIYISNNEVNHRKLIDPQYKANRLDKAKPKWLPEARDFLIHRWHSEVVKNNFEADDAMGVEQCQNPEPTVICSLDKDMLMIPGDHYNWNKELYSRVTELEGLRHFYKQMLIGDNSDNIKGIHGIGPVKASRIIDSLETEEDMFDTVLDMYGEDQVRFFRNANLLWIHQDTGVLWTHRSKHLLSKSESYTRLAEEVLLPLNISDISKSLEDGSTDVTGTELGGTQTEPTD